MAVITRPLFNTMMLDVDNLMPEDVSFFVRPRRTRTMSFILLKQKNGAFIHGVIDMELINIEYNRTGRSYSKTVDFIKNEIYAFIEGLS